jgi:hypothetical protein
MADLVFIIGAGCSKEAGAPTSNDFLDKARDLLVSGKLVAKRAEFALLFEALGFLQRVHSKAQLDLTNLESVFSALDIGWTLRKLPGIEDEQKISRVLSAMRWVIVKTLEHSIQFPARDRYIVAPDSYAKLAETVQRLTSRHPAMSTAIISFNYDICADVALDDQGLGIDYALSDQSGPSIPLLKLHGSMNWARHETTGTIIPWSIRDYRAKYQARWPADNKELQAPVCEQMYEALKGEGMAELPVLVPPLVNKGDEQRQLWKVWQRAARELSTATHIAVIGYSLPETDQFFRHLFALGTEGPNPFRKVLVFNPDKAVEQRFKTMLGDGALARFEFYDFTFGGTVNNFERFL